MTEESGGSTQLVFNIAKVLFLLPCFYFLYTIDPMEPSAVLRNQYYIRDAREKLGLPIDEGVVYDIRNGGMGLFENSMTVSEGVVTFSNKPTEQFKEALQSDE